MKLLIYYLNVAAVLNELLYMVCKSEKGPQFPYLEVIRAIARTWVCLPREKFSFLDAFAKISGHPEVTERQFGTVMLDMMFAGREIKAYIPLTDVSIILGEYLSIPASEIESMLKQEISKIEEAIFKASKAGELIQEDLIFNGLFIFGNANSNQNHSSKILKKPKNSEFKKSLLDALSKNNGINHIVSNDGAHIKKWNEEGKFSCYAIKDLAASYFFSNLLDFINNRNELLSIPEAMYDHLYPIPEGKETFIKWKVELRYSERALS